MFTWQSASSDDKLRLPGLDIDELVLSSEAAKFDLDVALTELIEDDAKAGFRGSIEFDRALFDESSVRVIANQLACLLDQVVDDPVKRLSELELISAEERMRVLKTWNDTRVELPDTNVAQLFAQQARRTPDAIAVESDNESISYEELNARANRLAHFLLRQGIGPDDYVAVVVPRVQALTLMLAVLKAGAAFLPIDPDYPKARIAYMLEDAAPAVVLATAQTAKELTYPHVILVDDPAHRAAVRDSPDTDPTDADRPSALLLDSAAYVVYTSGSTGRPKGVVVTARVLLNLLWWQLANMGADPNTRVSGFAAISFDAFEQDILAALNAGQTIVVPSEDVRRVPSDLAAWIERHQLNEFLAPNVVLQALLEAARSDGRELHSLRNLIQGGEPFQLSDEVRRFAARPGVSVFNYYGPSETHVVNSMELEGDPQSWPAVAPLGAPIWNARMYVLDSRLRPAPVGVVGELYIGGDVLARGYLNRPGLTAQRFVADPFGEPGKRMYRTGDLARWNEDGQLVFAGRADDQIKIRGVRVELGEINSVLIGHPQVAEAATLVHGESPDDRRLVSYVVAAGAEPPNPAELRAHAADHLPAAVVPAAFVVLDALPLNTNRKLDRLALPAPDFGAQTSAASEEPRSARERILCETLADVLDIDRVGLNDDFFELGGHSLLAGRLLSRIREVLGEDFSLRALFANPTVAGLLEVARDSEAAPVRTPEPVRPRPDRIPLSSPQKRLWYLDQLAGPSPRYNLPLISWRLSGPANVDALEHAVNDVVERHEALRTGFPDDDGVPYQRVVPADEARVRLGRTSTTTAELDDRIVDASSVTFDLTMPPLVRAELLSVAPEDHVFLLVGHHTVMDGGSFEPLAGDLATAYAARVSGHAPRWAPLPVQYPDYTIWARGLLGEPRDPRSRYARQSAFWAQYLTGLPDEQPLPFDRPRPDVPSDSGGMVTCRLDVATDAVRLLARKHGATPFMVHHAAFAAVLSSMGAGTDIALGTVVAGRPDPALDRLVGFFANTIVLRTDTSGDPTFAELLRRVVRSDLAALDHQELPFDRVVQLANPHRSSNRNPVFQVMMSLRESATEVVLPGLRVTEHPVQQTRTTKFDLELALVENGDDGSLTAVLQYSTDLFDRSTAEALLERLAAFLDVVIADPEARIETASLAAAA
ncbi:MAG: hypothetical protein AUG48_03460 [Actinobacteria bacterium 13_1_20CM_3_68_9]|nr:MAG: hypothetical protein AUG48_03460 [Actinobacteria bacterium 13_1_20CM_3_68_9]